MPHRAWPPPGRTLVSPEGVVVVDEDVSVAAFLHEALGEELHNNDKWITATSASLRSLNYIRAWQLVYIPENAWTTHFNAPPKVAKRLDFLLRSLQVYSKSLPKNTGGNRGNATSKVVPLGAAHALSSETEHHESASEGSSWETPAMVAKQQAQAQARRMVLEGWALRLLKWANAANTLCASGMVASAAAWREKFWAFWVGIGCAVLVVATVARYGAKRLPNDVLAETEKYEKLKPFGDVPQWRWKEFDGLETPGQRIVLAAAYAYLILCVGVVVLLAASFTNGLRVEGWVAAGFGIALLPTSFAFNSMAIRLVSLLEWMQSLAELLALMESVTLSVVCIAALWVINRGLEANQIEQLPGFQLHIPLTVFLLAMIGNICSVYTFVSSWRQDKVMLRIAARLQALYLLPLAISLIAFIATTNLGGYVITHCHQFVASLDQEFFKSFLGCEKYNGIGQVRDANGQPFIRKGPGEAIYCGQGSANKLRGAFAWEVSPVYRASDGRWVDYFGCLDYSCCIGLAELANETYDIIIGASVTLVCIVLLEWASLSYMKSKSLDEEEAHHLHHHATPFLAKLLLASLALLVSTLCILGYSHLGVVVIPSIEALSLKSVSREEACTHASCPPATPCESSLCCLNGLRDGEEVDVDCGAVCHSDGGRLCPLGSRCLSDQDCLSNCCMNSTCGNCALNTSILPEGCGNGEQDLDLFETCSNGGGDICRQGSCTKTSNDCPETCSAVGFLCAENEPCQVDLDCENGLRCASVTKRCTKAVTVFPAEAFIGLELLGSNVNVGDGAALGSNCTEDADCATLNCAMPACHTYYDAGPYAARFKPCLFPIVYQGTRFFGCIDRALFPPPGWEEVPLQFGSLGSENRSHQQRYWCSTALNANEESWGFCDCAEASNSSESVSASEDLSLDVADV